ncbi:hypothetical protein GQ457_18G008200 [Hibiscus cannabinus]
MLVISGERETGEEKCRRISRFRKEFPVSEDCQPSQIRAKFSNGILYLVMPKQMIPAASSLAVATENVRASTATSSVMNLNKRLCLEFIILLAISLAIVVAYESKEIWDNMIMKYTIEDASKQKFIIRNFYRWEMTEDVEVKVQINEYHKLLEDLKSENITLLEEFVAGHYAHQCRHHKGRHENPAQSNVNLIEADDIITAVVSQVNIVTNMTEWVIDSGATRHICGNRNVFTSYIPVEKGEESIYLGDSQTVSVLGKGKAMLKLTYGKTLALSDVLHVPEIRTNLISISLL